MGGHRLSGFAASCWLVLLLLAGAAQAGPPPSVALFYGRHAPLDELRAFDVVVVEPDHGYDPQAYKTPFSELFAYVSLGELHPSRSYFKDLPEAWKIGGNTAWGSVVIDQTQPDWAAFVADRLVAPLWQKGYRGLFLDTLDSYHLAGDKANAKAQQQGLIEVIRSLRARFPGIRLILNRGFELLPALKGDVMAVAAESLYRGWDQANQRYVEVSEKDRAWLLGQLRTVTDTHGLPAIAIDYVDPRDRALTRATAQKIRAEGFVPWVADGKLETLGIGTREVMPRRILVLHDGREAKALNFTNAHRYLAMPLNHLGYVPEYADITKELPDGPLAPRYAGIVTWFAGGIQGAPAAGVAKWLQRQIDAGMKVAMLGDFGIPATEANLKPLGIDLTNASPSGKLAIAVQDAMMGLEMQPLPDRRTLAAVRLADKSGRPLLTLKDGGGRNFDAAAITAWGGYVLDPFAVIEPPGVDNQARWVVDPFAFLQAALRLPAMPVPDTTTENGRRLLFAHIDGDGFPSRAEFPGSPLAAKVLLDEVLQKFRIPHTMSVIEAEVAADGLHPELAAEMEGLARQMFALPHVEIASHTYSHPFHWDQAELKANPDDPDAYYALKVPGYQIDVGREIAGSAQYIRKRLAPAGKPVKILLWSGDAAPGERSLRIAADAGLLNMNGGYTVITRRYPSLTAISSLGIEKGGLLQTYAPVMNENVYTNLWRGPFYGFERVIETFELTEQPRRLKPIDIYYHTYSASKRAALNALHKVYRWALAQPTHPIYASEFIRKVADFHRMVIARDEGAWIVRGAGDLRTLRAPAALGPPDLEKSVGVAGHSQGVEGRYIHLADGSADVRFASDGALRPYLAEANARLGAWQTEGRGLRFALKGYVPLEFALGRTAGCSVRADGRPLAPQRTAANISHYRQPNAAATIQVICSQP